MSKLNEDVLILVLEEVKKDKKSLYSCLFVNRVWCKATLPILWKNPNLYCKSNKLFFNTLLLHLSEESKDNLKNHGIEPFKEIYKRPLFHYIYFWKHLNLHSIDITFNSRTIMKNIGDFKWNIMRNEILNLLINRNSSYTHLYIHSEFDYQLYNNPGVKDCFLRLQHVSCGDNTKQHILEGLASICKSIKSLRIDIVMTDKNSNPGLIKLIEAQNNLNVVNFDRCRNDNSNEIYRKTLEESLIKNADTIQNLTIKWKPITNMLLHLVNLISLDINLSFGNPLNHSFDINLENVNLPFLKILRTHRVPSRNLVSLVENTNGSLIEINARNANLSGKFIQAICNNCPKIEYLRLSIKDNISELGKLLISCKCLKGLYIFTDALDESNWDELIDTLIQFSPINLYKFKFTSIKNLKLESLKFFLDNWEKRHSMLLQIVLKESLSMFMGSLGREQKQQQQQKNLLEEYKGKGIIKNYHFSGEFEDFEWIQKKYL
ncbi:hypothetical protein GLOIN_2v1790183 [Rhizophagus irregularis DAOM 181602=DAOM 197198]|nr:hypothetical protein GLOIN_2v1790183 [Rhizophagus irregularis DAOM 181602=DAOM 197198]EXX64528.1 hypothetical protein RirG_141840 [Rhizophagus irregularis DAOM 197198w]POG58588.1 hypothetical protein GLOIN_2v1790183 [Rhizophagus irregularis DAOM 181602=DAOM 197198]GBC22927.1 hypothetical protein GLOIN_2v1790183 [Rhizophagus irregularis DAOM 181602=DAOM 197198]CAG8742008.1 12870_t:CDS:1 [Rhizophagus irregularis]|eukprot:XP_025165454.1 hypothetical protein GLOIN_2v1790183 [Rhizophagus irregularis DAOM 181602=DAOM 197198]